ncbi:hypothetical protein PLANPX_1203 [Lacipirellula parvula]|uniref:J domain-containing protein n=2 Tax=Lacipirellula parvula TaxID=2650471 RepID=A0A5K7XA18_9BACT|nr:hypothetical protein PLANPX_1203 [Lacipirellula parvula]
MFVERSDAPLFQPFCSADRSLILPRGTSIASVASYPLLEDVMLRLDLPQLTIVAAIAFASLVLFNDILRRYRTRMPPEVINPAVEPVMKTGSPGHYVPSSFEALGLHADATPDDVLAAYRSLAMEAHPNHGGDLEAFTLLQQNFEQAMTHPEGRIAQAS